MPRWPSSRSGGAFGRVTARLRDSTGRRWCHRCRNSASPVWVARIAWKMNSPPATAANGSPSRASSSTAAISLARNRTVTPRCTRLSWSAAAFGSASSAVYDTSTATANTHGTGASAAATSTG